VFVTARYNHLSLIFADKASFIVQAHLLSNFFLYNLQNWLNKQVLVLGKPFQSSKAGKACQQQTL
jgi:hypothetical protein